MIEPITDKELVKELESSTTRIVNILFDGVKNRDRKKIMDTMLDIISWYINHNDIDANTSIYKKWDKISELLGIKPISHPVHSYKNALWAFSWKEDPVLIYYDKRGMAIQCNKDFNKKEVLPFLKYLKTLLT